MLDKGDLITLDKTLEYIVVAKAEYQGKTYVYIISKDGLSDVKFCSYEEDTLKIVQDEDIFRKLLELFQIDIGVN